MKSDAISVRSRSATLAAVVAGGAILWFASGCAGPSARPEAAEELAAEPPAAPDYQIGPEDVIEISVWRNDAVSRTVPVRPDGMISLPLINDVHAAGLSPMQLRKLLTDKLAVFLPTPEVSVIVREVHSVKVSVQGEVVHPGHFELKGPTTVMEILARAGGVTPFASRSQIVVLRPRGRTTERIRIDRDRLLNNHGEEDLILRSGDLVFVP
jgi:polysaccharide biosynthesis/export protein